LSIIGYLFFNVAIYNVGQVKARTTRFPPIFYRLPLPSLNVVVHAQTSCFSFLVIFSMLLIMTQGYFLSSPFPWQWN
jgi:hypothetical protein